MSILISLMKYLPYIVAGVSAVEQVIGAGNGATKKQLVLGSIQAASKVGEQIPETHVAGISNLIDVTVATLNATGLLGFGKKTA